MNDATYTISIHALRMERDVITSRTSDGIARFQSTRSAWSATQSVLHSLHLFNISIHALRMERDLFLRRNQLDQNYFNPRAPHGARLALSGAQRM